MKFFIVLSALVAVTLAKPHAIVAPLAYAHVVPGAPIGPDGRVVDTPEVSYAKAEHAAAQINERVTLAHEAVKSADHVVAVAPAPAVISAYSAAPAVVSAYSAAPAVVSAYSAAPAVVSAYSAPLAFARYGHGAPVGIDGRVVDTPEVSYAKAEHAAAHINEKVTLAHEAAKNYAAYTAPSIISAYSAPAAYSHAHYSAPAVVSAYSSYAAPAVVPAYSSLAHHNVLPAVSVW